MVTVSIPEKHVREVCKIGQGAATCRYLAVSSEFTCAKNDPGLKALLDAKVASGKMGSKDDNCEGK